MLTGKIAIVTGSTSGIGLATAEALAAKGCTLVVNSYSDSQQDHAVATQLAEKHGVEAVYIKADMAKPDECRDLIEKAVARFGSVDVLVNNAGIQFVAPVEEFPAERWDAIIAINLSSAFHTTAAAIPHMKASGWGRIVNIASAHGLRASPNKSAYVAAKHGVVGLTKTVALELAGQGVTCNAVCPGFVLTPLVETQIEDRSREAGLDRETTIRDIILAKQPSKQFATVAEIGAAVAFLCSNDAAQITGTTLSVDGGWTAQ
ncbi:3-hydroxybutyrate dehydrogenase [Mesorhizobium microcysteis]|uniref:3-hydroxybutyrate dehydrogenase n=1 Tax=Neoaquamicrobium microcysteis TaxID=2682781 RepID=A0A5D4H112_9HYPH|nr:3-hydroxybutyrate dehydrogenase [Mesorhizobium microcysteis]TYR34556.1 3-hydroxybutyrate dehydrogenase [Mesorhizobium microcysteis]